jgi:hypothetical protein
MSGIEKLYPVLRNGIPMFPHEIAVTGENVLMEHIKSNEGLATVHAKYINADSPLDKIFRPRIVGSPDNLSVRWILLCFIHNFKVLINRIQGYSKIIGSRSRRLFEN